MEEWLSGLRHHTRNVAWGKPYREFESHLLRRPRRLTVRTWAFQAQNEGSIPSGVMGLDLILFAHVAHGLFNYLGKDLLVDIGELVYIDTAPAAYLVLAQLL